MGRCRKMIHPGRLGQHLGNREMETSIPRFGVPECPKVRESRPEMTTIVPEAEFRVVYEEWIEGRLTRACAAARLRVCERTFRRYVARFREHGSQWWIDRSGRLRSQSRASDGEVATVARLYSNQYPGWTVRHFYDRYRDQHGGKRSYTWVKGVLQAAGLVEKRVRNTTPKPVRKRNVRTPIARKPSEGKLLHQVASRRQWVQGREWDLVLTVDDATSRVHSGFFVVRRGIWPVFRGIRETLEQEGLFDCLNLALKLPRRLSNEETAFGVRTMPQLERVMRELGIDICSGDPSLRSRPMRMIGTLLGRLPRELTAEGIVEIDKANRFLSDYLQGLNESLARVPSAFVALNAGMKAELPDVFCLKHEVRVCCECRLWYEGNERHVSEQVRQHLRAGEQYRIHEYEDGGCLLFNGRDTVVTLASNGAG